MKKNTIDISPTMKKELSANFETSIQTVQMSLSYVFNSELAKSIRKKAKEMLLSEAASINENQND